VFNGIDHMGEPRRHGHSLVGSPDIGGSGSSGDVATGHAERVSVWIGEHHPAEFGPCFAAASLGGAQAHQAV